jgi:hypothetical protein
MTIRVFKGVATFVVVFAMATVIFTMIWGAFVTDRLYNCTDAVGLDYVQPGNWVHGQVAFVRDVRAGRSMTEPDTIKEGWSRAGLWALWLTFFGCSVVVSALAAQRVSAPTPTAEQDTAPNCGPATRLGDS